MSHDSAWPMIVRSYSASRHTREIHLPHSICSIFTVTPTFLSWSAMTSPDAHRVVVLRRDLQHRLEAVRIAGLGEELLGLGGVVRHRARQVDEVRVERIDVAAEDPAHPEHRALQHVRLVDRVGHRAADADVAVGLLRVVHGEDDVVGGVADDDLEARVLLQIDHVLGAEAEEGDVDVAGLERGLHRVRIGDEAVDDTVELGQALHVVVRVLLQHDAVAAHPVLHRNGPVPIGALFSVSTASRG